MGCACAESSVAIRIPMLAVDQRAASFSRKSGGALEKEYQGMRETEIKSGEGGREVPGVRGRSHLLHTYHGIVQQPQHSSCR